MFMRQRLLLIIIVVSGFCCKKDSLTDLSGNWVWTIQHLNGPPFSYTSQSTGIQEVLIFNRDGSYALLQNGVAINTGTYHLSAAMSSRGDKVPGVYYTNTRVRDSVAYYTMTNNGDSLFFAYDLIGTVGSGSRHYGRQ
jgi:hypothetical protein